MKATLFSLLILFAITANSQTRQPFSSIGKKVKVVTLTNGKYDEFFDEDTLQRIGSSVININTKKITKVHLTQEEIDELENAHASRFLSVDPLTSKFSYLTPYQYASNTPIQAIDLDGLEKYLIIWKTADKDKISEISICTFVDAANTVKDNDLHQNIDGVNTKLVTNGDDYYIDLSHIGGACYSQTELDPDSKFVFEYASKKRSKDFGKKENGVTSNKELRLQQKTLDWQPMDNGYIGVTRKNDKFSTQTQTGYTNSRTFFNNGLSNLVGVGEFDNQLTKLNSKTGNTSNDQKMLVSITTITANKSSVEKLQKEIMNKYKNAQINLIFDDNYKSKPDPNNKNKTSSSTDLQIDITVIKSK